MPKPSSYMRDTRNAAARNAMAQEGVDPDQDLDTDAEADRGLDADFMPDRDLFYSRHDKKAWALGEEEADPREALEALYPPWMERGAPSTIEAAEDTGDTADTADTADTGDYAGLDTGDTADTADTGSVHEWPLMPPLNSFEMIQRLREGEDYPFYTSWRSDLEDTGE